MFNIGSHTTHSIDFKGQRAIAIPTYHKVDHATTAGGEPSIYKGGGLLPINLKTKVCFRT